MEITDLSPVENLLTMLDSHRPIDKREEQSLGRMKNLLSSQGDECFDQDKSSHHLTGSALVVSRYGLLLHFHKKIPLWLQPGGHLDTGESPLDAAIRETREETGIVADFDPCIYHVDVHDTPMGHTHYDIRYKAFARECVIAPGTEESQKVAWFSRAALSSVMDPALVGAIRKIQNDNEF